MSRFMRATARHRALATLLVLASVSLGVAQAADTATITIKNFMFSPASLTVKAGTTVTWTNQDNEPHSVVGEAGAFRSGAFDTAESFSFTFSKPGTYHFACSLHPMMTGTVIVE